MTLEYLVEPPRAEARPLPPASVKKRPQRLPASDSLTLLCPARCCPLQPAAAGLLPGYLLVLPIVLSGYLLVDACARQRMIGST